MSREVDTPLLIWIKEKAKEFALNDNQIVLSKDELERIVQKRIEEQTMQVRDPHFEFPPHLVFDYTIDKRLTRLLNALSLLFPVGERFFIESVRKMEHLVDDEQLQKDIKIFYRQEGRHGREHRKLNKILELYGVDVKKLEDEALERLHKYANNEDEALLVTVTLEKYTELLGLILPKIEKHIFKDNEYCDLYSYHAIEEAEHAHVAKEVMNKYRNISKVKEAKYLWYGLKELAGQTYRNYKVLSKVEKSNIVNV